MLSAQRRQAQERKSHRHRPRREEPNNLLKWGQNSIFSAYEQKAKETLSLLFSSKTWIKEQRKATFED